MPHSDFQALKYVSKHAQQCNLGCSVTCYMPEYMWSLGPRSIQSYLQ